METISTPDSLVTSHDLRQAMRHWTSGITVITASPSPSTRIGLVSNSFTSVSLVPPLVSWCVDRQSTNFDAWCQTAAFSVHILDDDDAHLIPRFAARGTDKFAGLRTHSSDLGTPALDAGAVRLDCRTWKAYDGGDHVIILGEVMRIQTRKSNR